MEVKLIVVFVLLNTVCVFSQTSQQSTTSKDNVTDGSNNGKNVKKPTLEAVYDFKKGIYITRELKPVHKQPIVLKIININKLANSVEIETNDFKINDPFLNQEDQKIKDVIDDTKPAQEIKTDLISVDIEVPKDLENKSKETTPKNEGFISELIKQIEKVKNDINEQQKLLKTKSEEIIKYEDSLISANDSLLKKTPTNSESETKTINIIKNPKLDELSAKKNAILAEIDTLYSKKNKVETSLSNASNNIKRFLTKTNSLVSKYTEFNC